MSELALSRRRFVGTSAVALSGMCTGWAQPSRRAQSWNLHVTEQPDLITAYCGDAQAVRQSMSRTGSQWGAAFPDGRVDLTFETGGDEASVTLHAQDVPIQHLHLRWRRSLPQQALALGDAWERSYGELAWLPLNADRPLPWYMLMNYNVATVGAGVKTGSAAFAFWQADQEGLSLWLDIRNGGNGVRLGKRDLRLATVIQHEGVSDESPWEAAQAFCRRMAGDARRPAIRGGRSTSVIYGSNDWYYAYGRNTASGILRDADLVAQLAPRGATQPFSVVDDGYQDPARFPSMKHLAEEIRSRGVRPGIWVRPLRAGADAPA